MPDRQRIRFIPIESDEPAPRCWHCGRAVTGKAKATFLYPRKRHVVVDRWLECECGAFQNVSHPHQISIEGYRRKTSPPG
jgi:hypothetical protein